MFKSILLITTVFVMLLNPVSAWDSETGLAENESIDYGTNTIFNQSTLSNPYRYYAYEEEFAFIHPSIRSNDRITINTEYSICKYIYNGTDYIQDVTCCITIEENVNLEYKVDVSGTGYWGVPDGWESVVSDGFLIKRYFQEMLNAGHLDCAEYNNSEEIEDPDIFYATVEVDVGNGDISQTFTGALVLDSNAEIAIKNKGHDFGFNLEGLGGEGGDDIFNDINLGSGLTSGSKKCKSTFDLLFYGIIPLFFMFAVFKMIQKVGK